MSDERADNPWDFRVGPPRVVGVSISPPSPDVAATESRRPLPRRPCYTRRMAELARRRALVAPPWPSGLTMTVGGVTLPVTSAQFTHTIDGVTVTYEAGGPGAWATPDAPGEEQGR